MLEDTAAAVRNVEGLYALPCAGDKRVARIVGRAIGPTGSVKQTIRAPGEATRPVKVVRNGEHARSRAEMQAADAVLAFTRTPIRSENPGLVGRHLKIVYAWILECTDKSDVVSVLVVTVHLLVVLEKIRSGAVPHEAHVVAAVRRKDVANFHIFAKRHKRRRFRPRLIGCPLARDREAVDGRVVSVHQPEHAHVRLRACPRQARQENHERPTSAPCTEVPGNTALPVMLCISRFHCTHGDLPFIFGFDAFKYTKSSVDSPLKKFIVRFQHHRPTGFS